MTENTDLVPVPTYTIDPRTGDPLDLNEADVDTLAEVRAYARGLEDELGQIKVRVDAEVHRRMDADASWTLPTPRGFKLKGKSPGGVEYDPEALEEALNLLVEEGKITAAARDEALEYPEPKPKVKVRGVNQLLRLGGDVKELIEEAQRPVDPNRRRVSVECPPSWYDEIAQLHQGNRERVDSAAAAAQHNEDHDEIPPAVDQQTGEVLG